MNNIAGAYLGRSFTAYTVSGIPRSSQTERTAKKGESSDNGLTPEEKREVQKLKKRDKEVRAHEQAHIAAGGSLIKGGASFEYQTGPDGKRYAVGGDVSIDTSVVKGDPNATIRKMQRVRKAALAPANPSAQDRKIASQASAKESSARQEKMKADSFSNQPGENKPQNSGYTSSGRPAKRSEMIVDIFA